MNCFVFGAKPMQYLMGLTTFVRRAVTRRFPFSSIPADRFSIRSNPGFVAAMMASVSKTAPPFVWTTFVQNQSQMRLRSAQIIPSLTAFLQGAQIRAVEQKS